MTKNDIIPSSQIKWTVKWNEHGGLFQQKKILEVWNYMRRNAAFGIQHDIWKFLPEQLGKKQK